MQAQKEEGHEQTFPRLELLKRKSSLREEQSKSPHHNDDRCVEFWGRVNSGETYLRERIIKQSQEGNYDFFALIKWFCFHSFVIKNDL